MVGLENTQVHPRVEERVSIHCRRFGCKQRLWRAYRQPDDDCCSDEVSMLQVQRTLQASRLARLQLRLDVPRAYGRGVVETQGCMRVERVSATAHGG